MISIGASQVWLGAAVSGQSAMAACLMSGKAEGVRLVGDEHRKLLCGNEKAPWTISRERNLWTKKWPNEGPVLLVFSY